MALNEIFKESQNVSLPVPTGTASGDPVRVGILNGVAQTSEGDGQNAPGYASVKLNGAHKVPVEGAVADVGDPIYITSAGELTATATGNDLWGAALQTQAADGEIVVKVAGISAVTGA